MHTEVILRVDTEYMRDDKREELIAWIKSLGIGIDHSNVRKAFVIIRAEQEYELHLTVYRRSPEGRIMIDRATEDAVTEPLIVPLGTSKSWPAWLEVAQ
jgi:hypothetical protein